MKPKMFLGLVLATATVPGVIAANGVPATIQERTSGSERVVVAQVRTLTTSLERNEYGDELIVSHLELAVEETLKGDAQTAVAVDVTGGTLGGVTLRVSSLPVMSAGERAVFFLERAGHGGYVPHLRGQGILKLDSANRVQGSSLTLDDVRRLAKNRDR